MVPKLRELPVDELYLFYDLANARKLMRMGFNNGQSVSPKFYSDYAYVPKTTVRVPMLSSSEAALVLGAEASYGVPVEVSSPLLSMGLDAKSGRRDIVRSTRNRALSLGDHNLLGFRRVNEIDYYSYGLSHKGFMQYKEFRAFFTEFLDANVDFVIKKEYIDQAELNHVMASHFSFSHVRDICVHIGDPRFFVMKDGQLLYNLASSCLELGALDLICITARKLIGVYGDDPLPVEPDELRKCIGKATGDTSGAFCGALLIGLRIAHDILKTPLDSLGVVLRDQKTRVAKDAETVRQRVHFILNTWMSSLLGVDWTLDEYKPSLFDAPSEQEG